MKNVIEFAGSALATTFLLRELLTLLVAKGVLSSDECTNLMDRSLLSLEQQQNQDVSENAETWDIARQFVAHLMSAEAIQATVGSPAD